MENDDFKIYYREREILLKGKGYLYAGMLWPNLAGLHNAIDNEIDGTKKTIFVDDYFPKEKPPKINYFPPHHPNN